MAPEGKLSNRQRTGLGIPAFVDTSCILWVAAQVRGRKRPFNSLRGRNPCNATDFFLILKIAYVCNDFEAVYALNVNPIRILYVFTCGFYVNRRKLFCPDDFHHLFLERTKNEAVNFSRCFFFERKIEHEKVPGGSFPNLTLERTRNLT
jgi:hypothetical protein